MVAIFSWLADYAGIKDAAVTAVGKIEEVKGDEYDYLRNQYYKRNIKRTAESVGSDLWVGGKTLVNSNTVLGDNVHFLGLQVRGGGRVTIGDNFHSGSGCDLLTENHNYEGEALPYDESFVRDPVSIGDNVWIGIDVTVVPGVSIGEGVIIQSGSVVTHDISSGAIAGGHPAEAFDRRDMDHYERLKSEGKFN